MLATISRPVAIDTDVVSPEASVAIIFGADKAVLLLVL
jgi:hypothetical protein